MMAESCPHERSAAEAARGGRWNDELAAHLAECVPCRESRRVARWMAALAEELDSRLPAVPDPDLIWLKARLLGRARRADRALLPIRIAGALAAMGSGAVLASLPEVSWNLNLEWLTKAAAGWAGLSDLLPSLPLTVLWIPTAIAAGFLLLFTWNEA